MRCKFQFTPKYANAANRRREKYHGQESVEPIGDIDSPTLFSLVDAVAPLPPPPAVDANATTATAQVFVCRDDDLLPKMQYPCPPIPSMTSKLKTINAIRAIRWACISFVNGINQTNHSTN